MKDSVSNAYVAFTTKFEGSVPFMYLDVKGLVTTGIGNLIDPAAAAMALPWRRVSDGQLASRMEIAAEWMNVKARTDLKMHGGMAYRAVTKLRLDEAGIAMLVGGKVASNERELRRRFPDFEDWPADAQLATHSMAWACGPAFHFPKLGAALLAGDFETAAAECTMNEAGNPGLIPRNVANRLLYKNAAYVVGAKLDPEQLYYPHDIGVLERTTETELPDPPSEPTQLMPENALDAYTCLRDVDIDGNPKG